MREGYAIQLFELYGTITLKDEGFESGLNNAENSASGFSVAAAAAFAAVAAASVKLGSEILSVGMSFESAMAQVAATSGFAADSSNASYAAMSAAAREMGSTTQYTATEAAEALNYMALAGWDVETSIAALPSVLNLATVGSMELGYASDLVTDSMTMLGLSVDDLDHYVDQLTATSTSSNTTVTQLGEAILVAGGQANMAGLDVTDLSTALGIMADAGKKGSAAGTSLRSVLKNLYTPTATAAAELERLGVSTSDSNGELLDMQDVLRDLSASLDNLTEAERMEAMNKIFDTRVISDANNLLEQSGERWDELAWQIDSCDGAAQEFSDTATNTLRGDLDILNSAITDVGIQIYESFDLALREAAQAGTAAIGELSTALAAPAMASALDGLASGISDLIAVFSNLATTVIPPLVSVLGLVGNAFTLVANVASALMTTLEPLTNVVFAGLAVVVDAASTALGFLAENVDLAVVAFGLLAAAYAVLNINQAVAIAGHAAELAALIANTAATAIATTATALFGAAMHALPFVAVAAGVVAVVAGLAQLAGRFKETNDAAQEAAERNEALEEAYEDLIESMEASAAAHEDALASVDAEAASTAVLADRLWELSGSYDGSAGSMYIMQSYVDQLNGSVDGLTLGLNEQGQVINALTGEVYESADAIGELLDKQRETAVLDAWSDRMSQQLSEYGELEVALQLVYEEEARLWQLYKDEEMTYSEWQEATQELSAREYELRDALDELEVELDLTADKMAEAAEETAVAEDAMEDLADTVEELSARQKAALDDMAAQYTTLADQAQNMWNRINDESALSLEEMIGNLEHNAQITREWGENVAKIAEQAVPDGLVAYLETGTEDAIQLAALLAEATPEELEAFVVAYEDAGLSAIDSMADALGADEEVVAAAADLATSAETSLRAAVDAADFGSVGNDVVRGYVDGIILEMELAKDAGTQLGDATTDAATDTLGIASPSRVFMDIGENVVQGLAEGILGESGAAEEAITAVVDAMVAMAEADLSGLVDNITAQFAAVPNNIQSALSPAIPAFAAWVSEISSVSTSGISNMVSDVVSTLSQFPAQMNSAIDPAIQIFTTWATQIQTTTVTLMTTMTTTVAEIVSQLPILIYTAITPAIDVVVTWGAEMVSAGSSAMRSFADAVYTIGMTIPPQMESVGVAIVDGVISGMESRRGYFTSYVTSYFNAIAATANAALDINSPSRVMQGIGVNTVAGFVEGLEEMRAPLKNSWVDIMTTALEFPESAIDQAGLAKATMDAVSGAVDATVIGIDAAEGFYEGLESMEVWLESNIANMFSDLGKAAAGSFASAAFADFGAENLGAFSGGKMAEFGSGGAESGLDKTTVNVNQYITAQDLTARQLETEAAYRLKLALV